MVRLLIDHGAKINATDKQGETPLHYAAENGMFVKIHKLRIKTNANLLTLFQFPKYR